MTNSGWKLKQITAPAVEPVTLAEAKAHCRVVISDDDTYLGSLIMAAREAAENYTRRAFVPQVWEAGLEAFPASGVIQLAKPSLIEVISVSYTDDDGAAQTLSTDDYVVDDYTTPARILRKRAATWPSLTEAGIRVRVRFRCGYEGTGSPADGADNVPQAIKQAVLLHVGEMYENRDAAAAMPFACEALLHPFRVYGWEDA